MLKKTPNDSYLNYLLGYLYQDRNNPARSSDKAKRHFRVSIASDKPYEDSFWYLSWLENDREQAKRILQRGLTFFPNSRGFHERLLSLSSDSEKIRLYDEIVKRNLESDSSRATMIQYYFNAGEFTPAMELIDKCQTQDSTDRMVLRIFKGACILESDDPNRALTEFQQLISMDITNALEFSPYFLSIVAISRQQSPNTGEALKIFAQIPPDFQFFEPFVPGSIEIWIDYLAYILEVTNFLLGTTHNKGTVAKIRGTRALNVICNEAYGRHTKSKAYKDLVYAHSALPYVSKYSEALYELAEEKGDLFSAYSYSLELLRLSFGNASERDTEVITWAFLNDSAKETFQRIVADFERRIKARELRQQVAERFFTPIIKRLHTERDYAGVLKLVNALDSSNYSLDNTQVLFEAAYALSDGEDYGRSSKYYELYLKKYPDEPNALNNLGINREHSGDLEQAEQLLVQAVSVKADFALAKKNLERVRNLRKKGAEFLKMSYKDKSALLRLWETKDHEGKIIVNLEKLPAQLGLSNDETKSILGLFIKNNILLPRPGKKDAGKNRSYVLNPEVRCHITEIEKEVEATTPIMEIVDAIANNGLMRIGYNQEIIDSMGKVSSGDLQNYLRRDLKEAAFSLLTRSYKTTQVMCGSIIEAVLLDKIAKQGKMTYVCADGKVRNINKMNLDQLLFVAFQEKLVDENLYHLAHGLRGYRNLIHPGVEQRKAVVISESNAKLSWDITRKLLIEI
jgi:hypothetical protein